MADAEVIFPHDFTGCHQTLFGEMLALRRRGALEMRALIESLRQSHQLEILADPVFDAENYSGATGEAYLSEILAARGSAMPEYVDQVMAAAIRREALNMSALIAAEAQDEGVPAEELLDNAERRAMVLRRERRPQEGMTLGDILGVYMPRIEGMRTGTVQPAWVPELPALKAVLDYVDQWKHLLALSPKKVVVGANDPNPKTRADMQAKAAERANVLGADLRFPPEHWKDIDACVLAQNAAQAEPEFAICASSSAA